MTDDERARAILAQLATDPFRVGAVELLVQALREERRRAMQEVLAHIENRYFKDSMAFNELTEWCRQQAREEERHGQSNRG